MSNRKILILETEEIPVKELTNILEGANFQMITNVASSLDLSKYLAESQIDCALLNYDYLLQHDKNELLEALKKNQVPTIFLFKSAKTDSPDLTDYPLNYRIIGEKFSAETLLKQIENTIFLKNKEEYLELKQQALEEEFIFLKNGSQLEKIKAREILYIISDGNYSMVQTEDRKYAIKISLKKLAKELPSELFVRIHRSYIVQIAKIDKIDIAENQVIIGKNTFPLGRYYKADILGRFKKLG